MTNYPTINFTSRLNESITMNNSGKLIGEDLIVGWFDSCWTGYSVYNQFGFRATPLQFKSLEDGIEFARFMTDKYGDYLILWHEDKRAKIPELTRYTIDGGLEILEAIQSCIGDFITFGEFEEKLNARLAT